MKVRSIILLALLAFAVTLVVKFPISAILAQVNTSPAVIHNPDGTVWQGSAGSVAVGPNRVDDVGWRVDFLGLFAGRVGANVDFDLYGGSGNANVSRSFAGNLKISDGQFDIDAQELAKQIPGQLVELGGKIQFFIDDWHFIRQQPEALRGEISWSEAQLKSPAEAALGTVNVTISPHSGGHTAQIDNEGGQLSVSGKIDVDKTGAFRADVRLKPSANAPADLDGTLGLLGRKGSDGSYRLRHNGRLSDFL